MIVSCHGVSFTLVLYFCLISHLSQIAGTVMYTFYKFVVIFQVCAASTFVYHFLFISRSLYRKCQQFCCLALLQVDLQNVQTGKN